MSFGISLTSAIFVTIVAKTHRSKKSQTKMQTTAVEQLRSRNTAVVFGTQINLSFYISKAMTIALVQQCHMSNK